MRNEENPCITCGACCTRYRVSFHWSETTMGDRFGPREPGSPRVPVDLTEPLGPHRNAMRGTLTAPVRCIALEGEIGCSARCSIHPVRPSPCREFPRSWEDGEQNDRCDASRAAFGLPPLEPPTPRGGDPVSWPAVPVPVPLPPGPWAGHGEIGPAGQDPPGWAGVELPSSELDPLSGHDDLVS